MSAGTPRPLSIVDQVGLPFLARRIHQLHELLAEQGQAFLADQGVDLDSRLASVLFSIGHRPGLSVAELADELDLSHQLATYRVKKLRDAGFAEQSRDPDDRSRYILTLTPAGKNVCAQLKAAMEQMHAIYENLFEEIGADLFDIVIRACKALKSRSIKDRAGGATRTETAP